MNDNPTIQIHKELQEAYNFFNERLFQGELPPTLITLQRGRRTLGYFSLDRFTDKNGKKVSEVAMNPDYFGGSTLVDTLSTLVHEMVHVWHHTVQKKPCRNGYHDKVWGAKMESVGLMPSNTGRVGGKKTGQQLWHYIIEDAPFSEAVFELIESGFNISWYDTYGAELKVSTGVNKKVFEGWKEKAGDDENLVEKLTKTFANKDSIEDIEVLFGFTNNDDEDEGTGKLPTLPTKGNSTRQKYTCGECKINLWGKPELNVICGDCQAPFVQAG